MLLKLERTNQSDLSFILFPTHANTALTSQGVEEAERAEEGFYIRSGITVVLKNATIKDGTII